MIHPTQERVRRHVFWGASRRRKFWTFGLALAGFMIGWQDQGAVYEPSHVALTTLWAGGVGLGLGFIFDQAKPSRKTLIGWSLTSGLAAACFAPLVPLDNLPSRIVLAATGGLILGALIGLAQLRRWYWW